MAQDRTQPTASGMQLSKIVHTRGPPAAPRSINLIDKLPAEIIHMICVRLRPTELANLRLVSRLVGPISLQYMVPEVHLILKPDSFKQLKAIAAHPIVSNHVTSLFFEAGTTFVSPAEVAHIENSRMTPRHHYSEESLREFESRIDLIRFQYDPHQRAKQEKETAEAMKRFPRLKKLVLTIEPVRQCPTFWLREDFHLGFATHSRTYSGDSLGEWLDIQALRSLLLGAYHAGLKVETLHCDSINWRLLTQDSETFARMRDSVSNVKDLRLVFESSEEYETEARSSDLEAGRLRDFVAAAPKLDHLHIQFYYGQPSWLNCLRNIVGEYHWSFLKSINLDEISATEDDLISFCSQHASTLKSVSLANIELLKGDWWTAFSRMHRILALDSIVLAGLLESPTEDWDCSEDREGQWPDSKEVTEAYFSEACPNKETGLREFWDSYAEREPNVEEDWSPEYHDLNANPWDYLWG